MGITDAFGCQAVERRSNDGGIAECRDYRTQVFCDQPDDVGPEIQPQRVLVLSRAAERVSDGYQAGNGDEILVHGLDRFGSVLPCRKH
jgi:hypothetical protein